jgi:hypothetical protein
MDVPVPQPTLAFKGSLTIENTAMVMAAIKQLLAGKTLTMATWTPDRATPRRETGLKLSEVGVALTDFDDSERSGFRIETGDCIYPVRTSLHDGQEDLEGKHPFIELTDKFVSIRFQTDEGQQHTWIFGIQPVIS